MRDQLQVCTDWDKISSDLTVQINRLTSYQNSMQLRMILINISATVKKIGIEEINCRRYKKQTIRHSELVEQVNNMIREIEQMITFATLLDGENYYD